MPGKVLSLLTDSLNKHNAVFPFFNWGGRRFVGSFNIHVGRSAEADRNVLKWAARQHLRTDVGVPGPKRTGMSALLVAFRFGRYYKFDS
jgi:hypothetical protein